MKIEAIDANVASFFSVIPAKAGIQGRNIEPSTLDARGQRCILRDASLRDAPQDEEEFVAERKVLMLRRPRSGRLEARTTLIQRFFHSRFRGHDKAKNMSPTAKGENPA
jgi:hypothetical protein